MPNAAAIRTLQDSNLEIPDPNTGINDRHFQFDLPEYVPRSSILMFRLRALENSTFQFRIQGTDPLTHVLQKEATRTFHEIYPGDALKEAGNELILFVGAGRVAVSDILVLYQVSDPFGGSVINVEDYGATGKDTTYDTDALKSAIDASQEGDALYFPTGTYVVSEPLRPKARQLYFSLTGATVRARPCPGDKGFAVFDVESCPVEFRNLAIDGGKDEQSKPLDPRKAPGIWVRPNKGALQVVVSGCRIRNTHGDGIDIVGGPRSDRASDRVLVRDTVVKDCGWKGNGNGLSLGRVDNVRIESSRFEGCHNGIKMHNGHNVLVRDVTAIANRRHGIVFTFSHRWHVDNCVAHNNGTEADVSKEPGGWGIAAGGEPIKNLAPNSDFTITHNICEANAEGGITLDPTVADDPETTKDESAQVWPQRARVSGNVCRGLRKDHETSWVEDATGSHGIHVRNSSAVVVTDNLCHHNNRSGIAVVNSSHVLAQANACYHNLHGIGLFSREGIENPGGHVIGLNMLHDNKGEDLQQGGSQVAPTSLPGVRLYGLHGSQDPIQLPANPGTLYEWHDADQGALYVKQTGNGMNGWVRLT